MVSVRLILEQEMRKILSTVLVTCMLSTGAQARDFGASPETEILTFDMSGGQKPRLGDVPILVITADGTVTARGTMPGDPPVVGHLDSAEQNDLFKVLIDDNGALTVSASAIETELDKSGIRVRAVPDAPKTSLSIALPEGQNSISMGSVSALANQAPDSPTLQSFLYIQRTLLDLAKRLQVNAS
jgi:hypothetical protein